MIGAGNQLVNANKKNVSNNQDNTTYIIKYKSNSNETKVNSISKNM